MTKRHRRSRKRAGGRTLRRFAAAALIFLIPTGLGADSLNLTTWYPAPYGVYSKLRSTQDAYFAYQGGSVGIGTTNPQSKLDINGAVKIAGNAASCTSSSEGSLHYNNNLKTMEYCDGASWKSLGAGVPSGTIAFFAGPCPIGWNEYTALRGRYIVATPSGGNNGAAVGTALNDQENRPTGKHDHALYVRCDSGYSGSAFRYTIANADLQQCLTTYVPTQSWGTTPGTNVAGTNAPYIQLTACQSP